MMEIVRIVEQQHCRTWSNQRPILVIIACLLAAAMAGVASAQGRGPSAVRVAPVEQEMVQEMRVITGDVIAPLRSNVAAQESGIVLELPVREGELVEQGQLLARLDSRRLALEVAQAQADILASEAVIEERRAELSQAEKDLELILRAYEQGAVTASERRDAEAAELIAQARLGAAERQVDALQARIDLLQERLADTTITAPFAGAIVSRRVDLGEWVAEGDSVVEVVSLDTLEVWLNVPQRFLGPLRNSRDAIAIEDQATQTIHESTQQRIIPQVDPRARTFALVLTVDNEEGLLLPGMSVRGWVPNGERQEHLVVAKNAVLRNEAGHFVYAVRRLKADGPPQAVPVQVKLLFPMGRQYVVQAADLREGESVVVEGNERLVPMGEVQPVNEQAVQDGVRPAGEESGS